MGVVRRDSLRRWSIVVGGVAVLCLLPAVVAAWPAGTAASADPVALRERILASADRPHQGYVTTDGSLGLPPLPELAELGGLLGGSERIRTWYAAPDAWRVAELTTVGERDTFHTTAGRYRWDFERNLVTLVIGDVPLWLPDASDVTPPVLGRRLLAVPGRVEPLPTRRVAGVAAAGVRLVPADRETTVDAVDVWADPTTGLPVRVEVAGGGGPAFTSRFLQLRQDLPGRAVLTPPEIPDQAGFTVVTGNDVASVLTSVLPGDLPEVLAGRAQAPLAAVDRRTGAAVYGSGLSSVVVVPLPGRFGGQTMDAATEAGGTPLELPGADAYQLRSSLLTAVAVHANGHRDVLHAWLLVGLVDPQVLQQGATELIGTL